MTTLSIARDIVEDHLDDSDNDRWTTTQIDRALGQGLSQCIDEYLASGGDRFDELLDTTSTTSGVADLSTIDPLVIKGVTMLQGSRYWPIKSFKLEDKNIIDDTARTLQIRYVRKFVLPTTTSHDIVGNGATSANSWLAFDNWICAKAALFCSVKDAEPRPELRAIEQDLKKSIMQHTKVPKSVPFPIRKPYIPQWFGYVWHQNAKDLILVKQW